MSMSDLLPLPIHSGMLYLHGEQSVQQVYAYTSSQMEAYVKQDRAARHAAAFSWNGFTVYGSHESVQAVVDMAAPAAPNMDAQKAADTLSPCLGRCPKGSINVPGWYLSVLRGQETAVLDGRFTADELEAIAFWMRHPEEVDAAAGK